MPRGLRLGRGDLTSNLGGYALQSVGEADFEEMQRLGEEGLVTSEVGLGIAICRLRGSQSDVLKQDIACAPYVIAHE